MLTGWSGTMVRKLWVPIYIQSLIGALLNIAVGITCSLVAAEMYVNNSVDFALLFHARTFPLAVGLLVLSSLFGIASFRREKAKEEELNRVRNLNHIRDRTSAALAEELVNVIRTGKDSGLVTLADAKRIWGMD